MQTSLPTKGAAFGAVGGETTSSQLQKAVLRAMGLRHKIKRPPRASGLFVILLSISGRGERIRTSDLSVPNRAHYQAVLRPETSLDDREGVWLCQTRRKKRSGDLGTW